MSIRDNLHVAVQAGAVPTVNESIHEFFLSLASRLMSRQQAAIEANEQACTLPISGGIFKSDARAAAGVSKGKGGEGGEAGREGRSRGVKRMPNKRNDVVKKQATQCPSPLERELKAVP